MLGKADQLLALVAVAHEDEQQIRLGVGGQAGALDDVGEALLVAHVAGVQADHRTRRQIQAAPDGGAVQGRLLDVQPVADPMDTVRRHPERLQVRAEAFGDDAEGGRATRGPRLGGADQSGGPAGADPALAGCGADEVLDDQPVRASQATGRRPGEHAAAQRRHHPEDGVRLGGRELGQPAHQEARLVQPALERRLPAGHIVPDPPQLHSGAEPRGAGAPCGSQGRPATAGSSGRR